MSNQPFSFVRMKFVIKKKKGDKFWESDTCHFERTDIIDNLNIYARL